MTRLSNLGRDPLTCERIGRALCEDREQLEEGMPAARAAAALVGAHPAFLACVDRFRAAAGSVEAEPLADESLGTLAKTAAGIIARERRLNVWCAWVGISRDARGAGLGALVSALETGVVSHDQTVEALRTAYARWLAPILIDARPALKRFAAVRHEDLIRTFRELDRELDELSAAYIRARLSARVPAQDKGAASQGYGVLTHELHQRTRHKPVRQLVAEMGEALTTLMPCLMMSPLSVAQFLPAGMQLFDLVVFDEASQITVPDAIGAIARGKHCIVVGDPKQMPPTRFFERGAEDDENEETRDLESILDEAMAARVPHHRLTGHYRSRQESLICFSNHAYYQGSLITYPAADTRDTAVTFRRIDGVYAKGRSRTNEIEAKAVVADVVRRLRDPKRNQLSIGVVTLNAEQQRLVEDLLDQERRADPDIERFFRVSEATTQSGGPEPVFVKNLETVQGDQRDVILLSVGYGPTEPGAKTMSMNFGPLNRQGGERRLNVAITRATTEVVVFASFDASMIDLSRTSAEAVKDLKHYIDFAARGPVALGEAIRSVGTNDYESDFEMDVAERLRSLGWTVRTQVGVSRYRIDLAVVHPDAPGRFLAGIECDGATYHSAPSARDRDRIRHIVLEQLGWRLLRIWSTDFFLDEKTSMAKLDARLRELLEEDRAKAKEAAADAEGRADAEPATAEEEDATEPAAAGEDQRPEPAMAAARAESDPEAAHGLDEEEHRRDPRHDRCAPPAPAPRSAWSALENDSPRMATPRPAPAAPVSEQVARAPRHVEGVDKPDPASPNLARFHDPSYLPQLKAMAAEIIDAEGPITLKRLSDRIARAHGFERTGKQIKGTVWGACKRIRRYVATPDEQKVFWPEGASPEPLVPFRGLLLAGERREWKEVPHPEKLWLVREILQRGSDDPARAVAEAIGFGRVTTQFRTEIAELMDCLQRM
jgi:very-short-patch-repair endonuclease